MADSSLLIDSSLEDTFHTYLNKIGGIDLMTGGACDLGEYFGSDDEYSEASADASTVTKPAPNITTVEEYDVNTGTNVPVNDDKNNVELTDDTQSIGSSDTFEGGRFEDNVFDSKELHEEPETSDAYDNTEYKSDNDDLDSESSLTSENEDDSSSSISDIEGGYEENIVDITDYFGV